MHSLRISIRMKNNSKDSGSRCGEGTIRSSPSSAGSQTRVYMPGRTRGTKIDAKRDLYNLCDEQETNRVRSLNSFLRREPYHRTRKPVVLPQKEILPEGEGAMVHKLPSLNSKRTFRCTWSTNFLSAYTFERGSPTVRSQTQAIPCLSSFKNLCDTHLPIMRSSCSTAETAIATITVEITRALNIFPSINRE